MSGHFYYAECLLKGRETNSEDKASGKSDERYQPAFKDEDAADQIVLCSETAKGLDVVALFNDQH